MQWHVCSQDRTSSSRVFEDFWSAEVVGLEEHQWHQLRQHYSQPAHSPVLWVLLGTWQHQCDGRYDSAKLNYVTLYITSLWHSCAFTSSFHRRDIDEQKVMAATYFLFALNQIESTLSGKERGHLPTCLSRMWSTAVMPARATEETTLGFGNMLTITGSQMRPVITTRLKTRVRLSQCTQWPEWWSYASTSYVYSVLI